MSPRPLFIATYLLAGAATMWITWAVGTLFGIPQFITLELNETQGDGEPVIIGGSYVMLSGLAIVISLLLMLLAFLDSRGARPARVLTWILGVPAVFAGLIAAVGGGFEETPWWGVLTQIVGGLSALLVTAALVLLSLPAARAHFRRPTPPPPQPPFIAYARPAP